MQRILAIFIAFACGSVMQFAFAPKALAWLGILAISIFAWLLLNIPTNKHGSSSSAKQALWIGFAFGFGWFAVGSWWLSVTLHLYGGLPWWVAAICVVLVGSILGLFPAAWAWLSHMVARRSPAAFIITFSASAVMIEWLRGHVFTGLPWTALGNLTLDSPWLSWASIVGVYGTGFLPALLAASLAALFYRGGTKAGVYGLFLLVVAALAAPNFVQPQGATYKAALVQASIPQDQKWDAEFLQQSMLRFERLSAQVAKDTDILIWPESAVPFFLEYAPGWQAWLQQRVLLWNKPLLFGGDRLRNPEAPQGELIAENGVFLFEPTASGEIQHSFAGKHHLVPFGEYVPSWLPWLRTLVPAIANFQPAEDSGTIRWQQQQLGALVCYESIFPEEARSRVQAGAQALVLVTNDAWYARTPAAWQHLQAAQMRAVETGRYVLRAGNTGITAIINPTGYIEATAPWWTRTVVQGHYQLSDVKSRYVQWGDMPSLAVSLLLLMLAVWLRKKT